MSGVSFELPVWGATFYHTERGATNPWNRCFNVVETGDEEEDKRQALKEALGLFIQDLSDPTAQVTIYAIEVYKLETLEGGEEDGSS